jgi:hypothetical protein
MPHETLEPRGNGPEVRATALATSGDDFGRLVEFGPLRFQRYDRGEVFSGVATGPLPVGATVTLGFREPGRRAAFGTVESCEASDRKWQIQVRIDRAVAV